jgi:HAD superfamily hydrolase (TIGR01549 family)
VTPPAFLLDVDGTLLDSNYQHAIAWFRTFQERGRTFSMVELHRLIGMGGDQLVEAIAGKDFDAEHGDACRNAEPLRFREIAGDVALLDGSQDLITALEERDCEVVLATSGDPDATKRALEQLEREDLKHTSAEDVEATKPQPDVVEAAMALIDGERESVLVGDSPWDFQAAAKAGIHSVGVLTGGFSEEELREAGAERVYRDLRSLLDDLDDLVAALSG